MHIPCTDAVVTTEWLVAPATSSSLLQIKCQGNGIC